MANVTRFGLAPADDNSGRTMTWDYQNPAFDATLDVITTEGNTIVQNTLTGACTLTLSVGSSTTAPYIGDKCIFHFTNDGSTRVVTFSTGTSPVSTTLSNTADKISRIEFEFTGSTWIEAGRSISA